MSSERYSVVLSWSNADDAYIATVPELPGCAADGATRPEGLSALEVVLAEWLETAKGWADRSPNRGAGK